MTYTKLKLSASVNGRQIKVAATATAGTAIHVAHATDQDEVWIYCSNSDSTDHKLTIEWGGVTSPDDLVEITIPAESGPVLVIPGWICTGGVTVAAFAASADVLTIGGFVNRISS